MSNDEFHNRVRQYGLEGAVKWHESTLGRPPTIEERAAAERVDQRATYERLRDANPVAAAQYGRTHPAVYAESGERVSAIEDRFPGRIGAATERTEANPFAGARARVILDGLTSEQRASLTSLAGEDSVAQLSALATLAAAEGSK